MRIPINLASNPYQNLRPYYTAAWMAATVLVALVLLLIWNERQNRNETRLLTGQINRMETQLLNLRREQRELEQWLATPAVQEIRDRSAFLNSLIARKSLSWTQMFMDLEKILPQRAQVTAIRPSVNQSQQAELKLAVAATGMAPLVEFLKNLESSPQFGSPMVESQRFPSDRPADSNISLELSTQYHQAIKPPPSSPAEATIPRQAADSPALAAASAGRLRKEER